MKRFLKVLLPIAVLLVGATSAWLMIVFRSEVESNPAPVLPPLVRVLAVEPGEHQFKIRTQGTVRPRTEIQLVPEVAGRVIWVSPSFDSGGFFDREEPLVRLDPRDYELAVTRARSQLAEARYRLTLEEAEARVAREEWEALGDGVEAPGGLVLREPQLAQARALLASGEAALEEAERNLDRCEIRAPFAGRVGEENADAGQFVTRGAAVARIYAVDYAEVRLPLSQDQLAFVELPIAFRGDNGATPSEPEKGPEVRLSAEFAGARHEWAGRVMMVEGEIDARTRMVIAVARVEDPYGRAGTVAGGAGLGAERPPLAAGMFVDAEIAGHVVGGVVVVPRSALHGKDRVVVVDGEDRLRMREVRVLRADRTEAVIGSGLGRGDRVLLTVLDAVVEGMRVRVEGKVSGEVRP